MTDDTDGKSALSDGLGRLRDRLLAYSDIRQRDPRESRDALSELLTDELRGLDQERCRSEQAMEVLRQIAGMKRRTREQRLASSCVVFLDCMDVTPNVEVTGSPDLSASPCGLPGSASGNSEEA